MRSPVLVLPMVLALAGCSGTLKVSDPSTPTPTDTATATATATATVEPTDPPSPTPTPSSTPTKASATPAPRRAAIDGDVDGDGKPDAVTATAEVLTVTLSASGRKVTAPVHADSPAAPEVLGSTDVDRDGFAEIFLRTTQGASTSFATPYRFDGTVLHELQLDGQPALLGFGGSVQHGDGFSCTDAGLVEVRKAEGDGTTYTITTTAYRLSKLALVKVSTATAKAKQNSPEVQASYAIDCGSVGEGG